MVTSPASYFAQVQRVAAMSSSGWTRVTVRLRDPVVRANNFLFNVAMSRPRCRQRVGRTSMNAEARLKELGIVLPSVPTPVANYVPYRLAGSLLFLSGQGPRDDKGAMLAGKVGKDVSVEEGYRRARLVGLGLLAAA